MRRLNNYMRASMGKDACPILRFCTPVDLDTVVDCWYVRLHPSTSTAKSSEITVSLILCDTLNIQGPFYAKRNPPRQKPAYRPANT